MKTKQKSLLIKHFDKKVNKFIKNNPLQTPATGWINTIRNLLGMSLRQFGQKLKINPASANEIEQREKEGSITLNSLKEAAENLGMDVVYYLIPKDGSIEKFIEKRANEIAHEIVMRTSQSMKLEEQENNPKRIATAIKEKTEEIKSTMPKYLWD